MTKPSTPHIDERDVSADAFEMACANLGLDLSVIHSVEIGLLRSVLILTAAQYRRGLTAINSDGTLGIAYDAIQLFGRVKPGH